MTPPAILSGLSDAALLAAFNEFVPFLDSTIVGSPDSSEPKGRRYRQISLERAIRDYCVMPLLNERIDDPSLSLPQLIIRAYETISAQSDALSLYLFNLYLYYMLIYMVVWYCHEKDRDISTSGSDLPAAFVGLPILSQKIRKYVQAVVESSSPYSDVKVSKVFYNTIEFKNSFIMDMPLEELLNKHALDHLRLNEDNKHIYLEGKHPKKDESKIWKIVRTEFVKAFRKAISHVLEEEIRQILILLPKAATSIAEMTTAKTLVDGYKSFETYAVGDGGPTYGFFGIGGYGLIFFGYEINDIDLLKKATIGRRIGIPLLDKSDKDLKASITYLGLDYDFKGNRQPYSAKAIIYRDRGGPLVDANSERNVYEAVGKHLHYPVPANGAFCFADDIGLSNADEVCVELITSTINTDPLIDAAMEEMVYVVFKHRLSNPMSINETRIPSNQTSVPSTSSFALSTFWTYPDNQFHMPATALPGIFPGQAADIASLVSALAADSEFEAFGVVDGLGIGKSAPPGNDGVPMRRDLNQNDRPPLPGDDFSALRYSHGLLKWYGGKSGRNGWLIFYAKGFVSPLRCTWETAPPGGNKTDLDTLVTPFVPLVGGGRSYNCALSAFRAFCIFEDMVRAILLHAKSQLSPAAYQPIEKKLLDCLEKETWVTVILPNGVEWPGRRLKHNDIKKFY